MIKWTGLPPWEFEFPFPGSLTWASGSRSSGCRCFSTAPARVVLSAVITYQYYQTLSSSQLITTTDNSGPKEVPPARRSGGCRCCSTAPASRPGLTLRFHAHCSVKTEESKTTLEATQGQIDVFFSQLPFKCHQNRPASVGDRLKICPWVTSRVGNRKKIAERLSFGVAGKVTFSNGKVFSPLLICSVILSAACGTVPRTWLVVWGLGLMG